MVYVKLTNKDCIHNEYQYKEGLNCLNEKFNNEKICGSGGLYFCRKEDSYKLINYNDKVMYYIWDVELCEDSKIVDMDDKFILTNKREKWNDNEFCKLAIQKNGYALKYVPQELITYEILVHYHM